MPALSKQQHIERLTLSLLRVSDKAAYPIKTKDYVLSCIYSIFAIIDGYSQTVPMIGFYNEQGEYLNPEYLVSEYRDYLANKKQQPHSFIITAEAIRLNSENKTLYDIVREFIHELVKMETHFSYIVHPQDIDDCIAEEIDWFDSNLKIPMGEVLKSFIKNKDILLTMEWSDKSSFEDASHTSPRTYTCGENIDAGMYIAIHNTSIGIWRQEQGQPDGCAIEKISRGQMVKINDLGHVSIV